MPLNKVLILIILIFPIIGLQSSSGFDNLPSKVESEVSGLNSLKSIDRIQLDHIPEWAPSQEEYRPSSQIGATTTTPISVACVFALGGLGDKGYNDMTYVGLQKAQADGFCTFEYKEPASLPEAESYFESYALAGTFDLIVSVGFAYKDAVNDTAYSYPTQAFLSIDTDVIQGNVSSTLFNNHQGSFLAGALAGLMTNTGRIGFIGGLDVALIREFWAGYSAGAFYERNNSYIEVFEDFVGGWNNPTTAKIQADKMWQQGVDIIFAAAGASGNGVFEFASETPGVYAIGVDTDQDYLYPGDILTSMVKRTDIAVYSAIQDLYNANWIPDIKRLGLGENGVGLSPMTYTKDLIGDEIIEEVNVTVRDQIIGGAITVPNDTIRLNQWIVDNSINNKSFTYTPPISISSDGALGAYPGSGSKNDPYRIKGRFINATSGVLIDISGTTAHFAISDCLLNGLTTTTHGINLQTVQNGLIINTTIYNLAGHGINLYQSENNTVTQNIVYESQDIGILLSESHNNTVSNNSVFRNVMGGITIGGTGGSHENYIFGNQIWNNSNTGIQLDDSQNNTIRQNTLSENTGNGIFLGGSFNNIISQNTIASTDVDGISLSYSDYNTIWNNSVSNTNDGMWIVEFSENNNISQNIVFNNRYNGIFSGGSDHNTISKNIVHSNNIMHGNGITLDSSSYCTISRNLVYQNEGNGISIRGDQNEISENKVYDNFNDGIFVTDAQHNEFSHNEIFQNYEIGFRLYDQANHNTFSSNTVNKSGASGISLVNSFYNAFFENTIHENDHNGIFLEVSASHNYFADNLIFRNPESGIFVNEGQINNTIIDNTIYDNLGYGLIVGFGCSEHFVTWNDFIWNHPGGDSQAIDEGENYFDENFWDEWTGPDANNDGIVDEKYTLAGGAFNFDHNPLTEPRNPARLSNFHFISRFTITNPTAGEIIEETITIRWTVPIDSLGHELTYKIFYSADGGNSWEQLAEVSTNSYVWDTTTVADGTKYVLRVEAADSKGLVTTILSERFTIDNIPSIEETSTTQATEPTSGKAPVIAPTPGFSVILVTLIFVGLTLMKYWKSHDKTS